MAPSIPTRARRGSFAPVYLFDEEALGFGPTGLEDIVKPVSSVGFG